MNVLVVTNMYPTDKNPFYGIFVKEQVESIREAGVNVDVFFINGIVSRLNYLKSIFVLVKRLRFHKYDIIHAHHSYCIFLIKIAGMLTPKKTPLILTFHEGEANLSKNVKLKDVGLIKYFVFSKKIKQIALNMVDYVITVESGLIENIKFKGKYLPLPCGINSDLFKPMKQKRCRQKLNLPLEKKIIFFPASPKNEQKGINVLREALHYLKRKDLLVITGGNIPHENMPYYMNAADVIVQLSIFEASPCVLKEAFAVNVPLVFTDVGDVKMIAKNTKGCFISKRTPRNVAINLVEALNFDGICNGRKRIIEANLTLKAISEIIVRTYKELLTY